MKNVKSVFWFQVASVILAIVLGVLLHYTYQLSNNNCLVGTFSAVNESTWEHLKLAFFPMLITTIVGYFIIGKANPNFLCAKLAGIITTMIFITTFFYTYTGIIGTDYSLLNILSFIIGVILGEYKAFRKILKDKACNKTITIIILILLTISFIYFTFNPPKINYFKDPITNEYGIEKN